MRTIEVNKNDATQRLDKFLGKVFKTAPKSLIYKWIRKKRVKINGKKQDISYVLAEGDLLELYINDEFFNDAKANEIPETSARLKVIYEDENILIAYKPSGLVSHGGEDNLLLRIQSYLFEKGEYNPKFEHSFSPSLCHRIDRNTEGLVIAAKNAQSLRIMNEKIKNREVKKFYRLKACKALTQKEGIIEGYTIKDYSTNKVSFSKTEKDGAKRAVTKYRLLNDGWVEAELVTGRTHQIRASFSAIGHPLEGDVKYGAPKNNKTEFQNLCAYRIKFEFTTDSGILEYLKGREYELD